MLSDFDALKRFTYAELSEATGGFNRGLLIRTDGFGDFYKGVLQDEREVTIKQYRVDVGFESDCGIRAEVNTDRCMVHRNIVSIVGYCSQGQHKLLVYQSVPNDCLQKHLFGSRAEHRPLIWEYRMKIAVGTSKALRYLHEECITKIIHRDVKSSNILLDYDYEPKVTDFAVAKIFDDDESDFLGQVIGTMGYLDPEYCMTGRLTEKADVYSFGVVLLELVTGKNPRELNDPVSLLSHVYK
ncbi:hypothetical protein KSS87_002935 [Heliosperma pusillum]|nr:hypothetical protein KSS87_002935 [Heliosperma pusillum]